MKSRPNFPTPAEDNVSVTISSVELSTLQQGEDYLMVLTKFVADERATQIHLIAGFSLYHLNLTQEAGVADDKGFIAGMINDKPYATYGAVLPPMLKAPAASLRWLFKGDVDHFRQHQERFISAAQVAGRAVFHTLREAAYDPSTVYQELLVKSVLPDPNMPPYFVDFATEL